MVNAQKWLNKNYKEKEKTTEIYINEKNLEEELDLEGFTNLEKIYISYFHIDEEGEIKIAIKDKDKYENKIIKLVNAQEWLESEYTKEKRSQIDKLDLSSKNLEGKLDLAEFTNLEEINICDNPYLNKEIKDEDGKIAVKMTAQEWLESLKKKSDKKIEINNKNLLGDLDLTDFTNLAEINITGSSQLGKINKRKETKIIITSPQELLNREYPENGVCLGEIDPENKGKRREEIFKLDLTNKKLKGELKLEGFTDLRVLECDDNELTSLDINTCPKLEVLSCGNNKLKTLNLDNNKMLTVLACWNNEVRELGVNNCPNLKKLGCSSNQLTELDLKKNQKLESLDIADNRFPKQNLSFLSHLTNLQILMVGNGEKKKDDCNHFEGNLNYLSNMKKLRYLNFNNAGIEDNFEKTEFLLKQAAKVDLQTTYRPNAYEYDGFNLNTIGKFIKQVGFLEVINPFNASNNDRIKNMFIKDIDDYKLKIKEAIERAKNYIEVKKASEIPNIVLLNLRDRKLREEKIEKGSDGEWNGKYSVIYPNDRLIRQEINDASKPTGFPKKLYDIKDRKIIISKEKPNKNISYATLSYVWNDHIKPHAKKKIGDEEFELSPSINNALDKAIETCRILDIDYLWMDKICINQSDPDEKSEEVSNMYQNYNNSAVTLVSINKNIQEGDSQEWDRDSLKVLEEIVDSDWFTRSWTFQEGWLSKRTIFMFDDLLIDGAFLAKVWAFNQSADAEGKYISRQEFEEGAKKIATPIGWVRHEHGYKAEDRLTMSLHEALRGVKERRRGVPLDGIYSVLGLLPYGNKVRPNYKPRECSECEGGIELKECHHEEKYKGWPTYTKEDAEKALIDVMKAAVDEKHYEPLSWYGSSSKDTEKSWLPKIKMDNNDKEGKNGSVEVWGGINIKCEPNSIYFDDTGAIALRAKRYYISGKVEDIIGVGGKSISGGTYSGKIRVEGRKEGEEVRIEIWGTKETLRGVEKGNHLIVPDGVTKSDTPFSILVSKEGDGYKRIGLIELEKKDEEKLERMEMDEMDRDKIIVIDFDEKGKSLAKVEEAFQSQIQIPPKGNN